MKCLTILFFLLVFSSNLSAQGFAEFNTDTTRFEMRRTKEGKLEKIIPKQVWYINGQKMWFGSGRVKVKVNPNKMDTILYQGYRHHKMDTILCNISEPKKYTFYYNACCGAFNIKDESNKSFTKGKVLFQLKNKDNKSYLGTLGEAGILVTQFSTDTLYEHCRSAMSPNVYPISFQEIAPCRDSIHCQEGTCLQVKNDEVNWEYGYRTISKKAGFLYMPLNQDPLLISYDPKTNKIVIR